MTIRSRLIIGFSALALATIIFARPLVVGLVVLFLLVLAWADGGNPSVVIHAIERYWVVFVVVNIAGYVALTGALWVLLPALRKPNRS